MMEDPQELVKRVRKDRNQRVRAVARLMTLIQNAPERTPEFLIGVEDWPSARIIIGLTGPPGCGKSLLVDRLITAWRARNPAKLVGVIAVDASSPFTNGAFLGDRLRMMGHANDANVFIRSAASRGHIGGLMLGVRGFIRVLGLAGCEMVLIETVGVGQNETEVTDIADLVVVTIDPGHGDTIQLLKSGLMEVGDVFVVNKADRDGAAQLHAQLLSVLRLKESGRNGRMPDVCLVSALHRRGIEDLIDVFNRRAEASEREWQTRRRQEIFSEVREAVLQESRKRILRAIGPERMATADFRRILTGELTIADLVDEILQKVIESPDQKAERYG
jgi:LAO/AO transport system kinase